MSHIILFSFHNADRLPSEAELAVLMDNVIITYKLPPSETLVRWHNDKARILHTLQHFEDPQDPHTFLPCSSAPSFISVVKFTHPTNAHFNTALRVVNPAAKTSNAHGAFVQWLLSRAITKTGQVEEGNATLTSLIDAKMEELKELADEMQEASKREHDWRRVHAAAVSKLQLKLVAVMDEENDNFTTLAQLLPYPDPLPTSATLARELLVP